MVIGIHNFWLANLRGNKLGSWEWGIIIIMTKVLDPAGSSHIFSQFEGGLVYFRFQVGNVDNHQR